MKIKYKIAVKLGYVNGTQHNFPLIERELNNAQWAARRYYFNLTKLRAELVIKPAYAGV